VTVNVSGHPVEVLRSASGVNARSLLCTHQGCEVSWSETDGVYSCPCHEGKFDAEGRQKEGPPPKPLPTLPARIEGQLLLVGP
jgi:Rieske Fe-S protein